MKPKEMTVSRGVKFSKNYNVFESHVSLTVELDAKEDPDKVYDEACKIVGDIIFNDIKDHITDMKEIIKEEKF